jgi:ABC-type multidrug transport system ATPase subunit
MTLGDLQWVNDQEPDKCHYYEHQGRQDPASLLYFDERGDKPSEILKDFHASFPDFGLVLNSAVPDFQGVAYDVWIYAKDFFRDEDWWRRSVPYPFARTFFSPGGRAEGEEWCNSFAVNQPTSTSAIHNIISAMTNGLIGKMWTNQGPPPSVESKIVRLPKIHYPEGGNFISPGTIVVIVCFPLISMSFYPVMTWTLQAEKVEKNLMAMQLQSLRLFNYWVATYLWDSFLYWSVVALYLIMNKVVANEIFEPLNWGQLVCACFLWGHSQVGMAVFQSAIMGKSKLSTLLCYMIILIMPIASPILLLVIRGKWPTILQVIPPLNFVRASGMVVNKGNGDFSETAQAEFDELCGAQFGIGSLLLVVGVVLHIFFVNDLSMARILGLLQRRKSRCPGGGEPVAPQKDMDDEDVVTEENRLLDRDKCDDIVQIRKLWKVYPDGYAAVKGVSFGIPKGECFGLLGPNGAGKTTVISMLSGSVDVTNGEASICGLDVRSQMKDIHKVLGVCPQFDIVYQELTIEEHLLLFARIKGIKRGLERGLVRNVAEAVGLDGDPFRTQAKNLSGGMRRRLSLAIALVANPRVVYLDEPSTGLDPETRQGLWRVVSQITADRSIVLTTHSMEEADALCHRIGIMAAGQLRCLGSPVHLKNKFGHGYHLAITMEPVTEGDAAAVSASRLENLDNFVRKELAADAKVMESWKGAHWRTYLLPKDSVQVSRVFEVMTKEQIKELSIQEWSLNQTSLNEVFLQIAADAEAEQEKQRRGLA